jgi:hypothetical protein
VKRDRLIRSYHFNDLAISLIEFKESLISFLVNLMTPSQRHKLQRMPHENHAELQVINWVSLNEKY